MEKMAETVAGIQRLARGTLDDRTLQASPQYRDTPIVAGEEPPVAPARRASSLPPALPIAVRELPPDPESRASAAELLRAELLQPPEPTDRIRDESETELNQIHNEPAKGKKEERTMYLDQELSGNDIKVVLYSVISVATGIDDTARVLFRSLKIVAFGDDMTAADFTAWILSLRSTQREVYETACVVCDPRRDLWKGVISVVRLPARTSITSARKIASPTTFARGRTPSVILNSPFSAMPNGTGWLSRSSADSAWPISTGPRCRLSRWARWSRNSPISGMRSKTVSPLSTSRRSVPRVSQSYPPAAPRRSRSLPRTASPPFGRWNGRRSLARRSVAVREERTNTRWTDACNPVRTLTGCAGGRARSTGQGDALRLLREAAQCPCGGARGRDVPPDGIFLGFPVGRHRGLGGLRGRRSGELAGSLRGHGLRAGQLVHLGGALRLAGDDRQDAPAPAGRERPGEGSRRAGGFCGHRTAREGARAGDVGPGEEPIVGVGAETPAPARPGSDLFLVRNN